MRQQQEDKQREARPPSPPPRPPPPPGPPPAPSFGGPVQIRRDYNPKVSQTTPTSQPAPPTQYLVSPITGEKISADKMQDHMRYGASENYMYVDLLLYNCSSYYIELMLLGLVAPKNVFINVGETT